jgi:acetoin utilization deacetylase AcuC-like enzyme
LAELDLDLPPLKLSWHYHPGYNFSRGIPFLKQVHGFVLDKPKQIKAALQRGLDLSNADFEAPAPVSEDQLAEVHTAEVIAGLHSAEAIAAAAELGAVAKLPTWLCRHMVVKPQLLASGGTVEALARAAKGGWAFNLGGGYHHARPDLSHGFCLVNDVALAVHALRRAGGRQRILVLDLDLHQGDGNAAAFADVDDVFTASLHQEDTFPDPKLQSDLDVGLRGGSVNDVKYLSAVDRLLQATLDHFDPDVVIYVAGTDPYRGDGIGDFDVSADALMERDRRVGLFANKNGCGLAVLTAGGYSRESPGIAAQGMIAMAQI